MTTPMGKPAIRRLRSEVLHFFDTNFLVLPGANLPLLKHVPERPRWITETVREEAAAKLGTMAEEQIDARYQTLHFNDLYRLDPGICPTYYWYILAMYNPANVGSEDFAEEMHNSRIIKDVPVTQEQQREYRTIRRQSSSGHTRDHKGQTKSELLTRLDRLASRTKKKATAAMRDGHPAYLRDIKNLALLLYHCLSTRKNTVYYTTDGDPVVLFLKWLDSITMAMTLGITVLPKLGPQDRRHLMLGGNVDIVLDVAEFVTRRHKLFKGFVEDRRKTKGCRFTIKQWNQLDHKFEEDVYLWFEDTVANGLIRAHGTLSCYFTKNAELGNWLHMAYHWPPAEKDVGKLRVNVKKKAIVNRKSSVVSPDMHDGECRYRREDACNKISEWSQFIVPNRI